MLRTELNLQGFALLAEGSHLSDKENFSQRRVNWRVEAGRPMQKMYETKK